MVKVPRIPFADSADYWRRRYEAGGDSGVGSGGELARFKADTLNHFVRQHDIRTVIELGCGDGRQLELADYPGYLGVDVSPIVIEQCRTRFVGSWSRQFVTLDQYNGERGELALSLDVIYHLVEDDVFDNYMRRLFDAATRYVGIYSSNHEDNSRRSGEHIRHRCFRNWIKDNAMDWALADIVLNHHPYRGDPKTGSWSDFYFYERLP